MTPSNNITPYIAGKADNSTTDIVVSGKKSAISSAVVSNSDASRERTPDIVDEVEASTISSDEDIHSWLFRVDIPSHVSNKQKGCIG